jgi:hypothetical protein
MAFMMSKLAYLFDAGDHNGPHVMFFTAIEDDKDWGAGAGYLMTRCEERARCRVGHFLKLPVGAAGSQCRAAAARRTAFYTHD